MDSKFYSNGKLLLTGEYAVLDAALSLAVPTKYGQSLTVQKTEDTKLTWNSLDDTGSSWFSTNFNILKNRRSNTITLHIENKENLSKKALEVAETLLKILSQALVMNPSFLTTSSGYYIETKLTFPRNWGLGSSSTLINNIASWAKVDPYTLLWNSFSGSAYDIACAQHNYPITYKVSNKIPIVEKVDFNPSFKDQLYFVHLNKKQNSREGIATYKNSNIAKTEFISTISKLTTQIATAKTITEFNTLITTHEQCIANTLQIPTVKELLFPAFTGSLKSLGAWGGDFILATGSPRTIRYFKNNGYETVIPYAKMIL